MIQLINRTGKFMSQLTDNQKASLEAIGAFLKGKMDSYTPVDTGNLKSHNSYKINNNELFLHNDCEYAGYVENGTYKMGAQPFMKPAAYNHIAEIKQIAIEHLSRGMK
jgi:HK97 gp10 family phage protein